MFRPAVLAVALAATVASAAGVALAADSPAKHNDGARASAPPTGTLQIVLRPKAFNFADVAPKRSGDGPRHPVTPRSSPTASSTPPPASDSAARSSSAPPPTAAASTSSAPAPSRSRTARSPPKATPTTSRSSAAAAPTPAPAAPPPARTTPTASTSPSTSSPDRAARVPPQTHAAAHARCGRTLAARGAVPDRLLRLSDGARPRGPLGVLADVLSGDRDQSGRRPEVLGIWWQETEGAKFWLAVLNDFDRRGVEDNS